MLIIHGDEILHARDLIEVDSTAGTRRYLVLPQQKTDSWTSRYREQISQTHFRGNAGKYS